MATCPKCGAEFRDDAPSVSADILNRLMQKIGGPEKLAEALAEEWRNSEGHKRIQMHTKILSLLKYVEKFQAQQQHVERITAAQERAVLMEYALEKLSGDEEFRRKFLEIARRRDIPVLEAECARLT